MHSTTPHLASQHTGQSATHRGSSSISSAPVYPSMCRGSQAAASRAAATEESIQSAVDDLMRDRYAANNNRARESWLRTWLNYHVHSSVLFSPVATSTIPADAANHIPSRSALQGMRIFGIRAIYATGEIGALGNGPCLGLVHGPPSSARQWRMRFGLAGAASGRRGNRGPSILSLSLGWICLMLQWLGGAGGAG